MKKIRAAIRQVCAILLIMMVVLGAWLGYTVYSNGSRWVASSQNKRILYAKRSVSMGDIIDRNGIVLATTDENGERQYHENKSVRRAVSQTVGDQLSMSGTGVETFHANTLLGTSGSVISRAWQYVTGAGYQGDNIRLTVDSRLALYASKEFPSGKNGAVVVLNYKTGEVLCMVSKADYDPKSLSNRMESGEDTGTGYLNRCLQGQYAPGSVFKIVTLISALENMGDAQERMFLCEGSENFGTGSVTCFGGTAHGGMTLMQAFAKSCNVAFASIAHELGAQKLIATAENLCFNDDFRFRDIVLYPSSIPKTIESDYDLAWTGVGQGKLLATPMHMALIAAAIGNGGMMVEPELILQVTSVGNIPRLRTAPGDYKRVMQRETAEIVKEYMRLVVKSGTGKRAAVSGYTVCGKTGTAEVSDDKSVKTNAWFVGFVAEEECPYAIVVIVERGGSGGDAAAKLAAKVLKKATELAN
ncbi:MAG: penicillin-binding transpeptidase domain-containing protein [Christensenellales bacterium]|jgi:peptidoglycan glycosyltransferase